MDSSAIIIKNLKKNYGSTQAVRNLSFDVKRGEMFCLVGPDGAGKSSTMRILCGILARDGGEVMVLGMDIDKELPKIKSQIGYLSQQFSLYGDLTVDENIEFFAEIHNVWNFKARREELLDFTRLKPFRKRFAERLSGGMKQKLALACTLIHQPQLIILDEPTTGVDPVSRRDFWRILSTLLKDGITILMSTPYLDEAERCSRVAMMNEGEIIALDTPHNIKSTLKKEVIEIVCSDSRRAYSIIETLNDNFEVQLFGDRIKIITEKYSVEADTIERALSDSGIEIKRWRVIPPSLENVFISLLGSKSRITT